MRLMQNAETINRLVAQGELLLKRFHAECEEDPVGCETEFRRGEFTGWRDTLHTLYHDYAEEIVDRVTDKTCLTIPVQARSAHRPGQTLTDGLLGFDNLWSR